MHSNIIVLISVTLLAVLVQNSHTFRVASKNGNYYRQQQQPVGANSDEIGSLSDLLYLTDNDDLGGDDSTENDEESGELLKLLPKLSANNNNRQTADEYDEYFAELNRISQQQQPSSVAAAQSPSSSSSSANNSPVDEEELESHSSLVGGQGLILFTFIYVP